MQDHRVRRDQSLAGEPIDLEDGRSSPIELGKLLIDGVEAFHCSTIIVLEMAGEQALG